MKSWKGWTLKLEANFRANIRDSLRDGPSLNRLKLTVSNTKLETLPSLSNKAVWERNIMRVLYCCHLTFPEKIATDQEVCTYVPDLLGTSVRFLNQIGNYYISTRNNTSTVGYTDKDWPFDQVRLLSKIFFGVSLNSKNLISVKCQDATLMKQKFL